MVFTRSLHDHHITAIGRNDHERERCDSPPGNTSSESEYSVSSNSEKLSNRNRAKIHRDKELNSKRTVIENSNQNISASKKKEKVSIKI
jgi:hypothetical protein